MAEIFISYAKTDRNLAQQLAANLEAHGRTTWWDTTVGASDSPRSAIERELERAAKVIVLWSQASLTSPFVLHEAITARDGGKLVQVKTASTRDSDIPRSLRLLPLFDIDDLAGISHIVSDNRQTNDLLTAQDLSSVLGPRHESPGPVRIEPHPAPTNAPPEKTQAFTSATGPDPEWKWTGSTVLAVAAVIVLVTDAGILWHYGLLDGLFDFAKGVFALLK